MNVKNALMITLLATPGLTLADIPNMQRSKRAIHRYADMVYNSYQESLALTKKLDRSIQEFLNNPGATTLQNAKNAWTTARQVYGQTESYRFYDGPIDNANGPEGQINAWPMDEAYVDYVEGNPNAGIINKPNLYPKLSTDLLISLNEEGGEANVSTGYHAIEFLLWGQDLSIDGPGNRPVKDFIIGSDSPNVQRRRQYLKMVSDLLVSDLESVTAQWHPETGAYRKTFVNDSVTNSLKKMWTGIVFMAADELSSERMFVAYDTKDQEDEHSCFSDTTYNDIVANALSVTNVYYGQWNGIDGVGLHEVLLTIDSELAAKIDKQLNVTMQAVRVIPQPFDAVIGAADESDGRKRLISAIAELQSAGSLLQQGAKAMGITINL